MATDKNTKFNFSLDELAEQEATDREKDLREQVQKAARSLVNEIRELANAGDLSGLENFRTNSVDAESVKKLEKAVDDKTKEAAHLKGQVERLEKQLSDKKDKTEPAPKPRTDNPTDEKSPTGGFKKVAKKFWQGN